MQSIKDINLFEYLEEKVDNSSFCSNASSILRLITENIQQPITKINPISRDLCEELSKEFDDNTNDESSNCSESDQNYSSIHNSNENIPINSNSEHRVRFSNDVIVNEINPIDLSIEMTSTPNQKNMENSNELPSEILETSSFPELNFTDTTLTSDNLALLIRNIISSKENEIFEKNELLKKRLKDLEMEIAVFQQQNQLLTKMKQEHELEKIEHENLVRVAKEKLENDKREFETYLNDEKIKLKEEKLKFEKKLLIPSKKEREEISKLREQITELEQEMKTKDNKYISSQSRLRAQIRNLEKQIREKDLEIEGLQKENKKLDNENIRLRRQNNTKMLNEINKNIAKLAPKVEESEKQKSILKDKKPHTTNKSTKIVHNKSKLISSSDRSSSDEREDPNDSTSSSDDDEGSKSLSFKFSNRSLKKPEEILTNTNSTSATIEDNPTTTILKNLKREINNPDGSKDIWYPNGNIKKISPDGLYIKMLYYNKDIKETDINKGTVKYYYAETNTWHTSYLDGLEILEYPK